MDNKHSIPELDALINRFEQSAKKQIGEMAKSLAKGHQCFETGQCECCMITCPYYAKAKEQFWSKHQYSDIADQMLDILIKIVLDLVPEKMIAETVRFDSPYGILHTIPGVKNMQEAEELKDRYNKLQELRRKYNGQN